MVIENFALKNDFQEEPPLVPSASQKAKRAPVARKGSDLNSNSSSTTLNGRQNIVEGIVTQISDDFPQRGWLSRISEKITEEYILDSIGGAKSFVYVIDSGLFVDHAVNNPSALLAFFFFLTEILGIHWP